MVRTLLTTIVMVCFTVILSMVSHAQDAKESDILPLEGVAALVNDEPISFFDVRQRVRMLMVTLGAQPTPEVLQQLSGPALEQLVDERLQLQMAREFELEIAQDQINSSVDRRAQQAGTSMEELTNEFKRVGISMRTLEEQIRAEIAWSEIMRGRFGPNIRISKDRINAQMEQFRTDSQQTMYQLSEIFLYAPDEEKKIQARTAADTLIEQLRAGTPFGSMAQQISRSATAAAGGDMGWVRVEDLEPALADAVTNATSAGILEPIIAEDGIYILALRGKREPQDEDSFFNLRQIVATDTKIETLEAAMDEIKGCRNVDDVAANNDSVIAANLGDVKFSELALEPQALLTDLGAGQTSAPFEMSRGWAAIVVCSRKDGAESLPSDDQVENQLYGRELNMISERELRNARQDATILR